MSQPMRIAVFLGTFPVISETFILRQLVSLIELGHDIRIYADYMAAEHTPAQPEIASHHLLERTTAMSMPADASPWEMPVLPVAGKTWLPGEPKPVMNVRRLLRAFPAFCKAGIHAPGLTIQSLSSSEYGHQAASLSALYRLACLVSQPKGYDLLHAHFGPTGNSYRFARRLWRAPLLVSFHGYDFSSVPGKFGPRVYTRLFEQMDAATVNSEYMRKGLIALGCPPNKLHKVPYGVDLTQYDFKRRSRDPGALARVLTVGRLVEKKGLEYSIRAFAKVHQRHPLMTYDIVGEGPLKSSLQELIRSLGLAECVRLHGARDRTAIGELLSGAHIFMLTSVTAADGDREGTPVSLLEAQAAGLPVLSTHHSGIPEIVMDGTSGFLVPERDVESLATRLEWLVTQPEACSDMGRRGVSFVSRCFSQEVAMRELLQVYARLRNQAKRLSFDL